MEVPTRFSSGIRQKNVLTYLESESDELIEKNNIIVKTLRVNILSETSEGAWEEVKDMLERMKQFSENKLPNAIVRVIAIDYSNSTYKDKKTGENKKSSDYGFPYLNVLFMFKNSETNEKSWDECKRI